MAKQVTIGKRPSARPTAAEVDQWMNDEKPKSKPVGGGSKKNPSPTKKAKVEPKPEKMKRLTIDIPDALHRRVKGGCANEGIKMADVIREFLEGRFSA